VCAGVSVCLCADVCDECVSILLWLSLFDFDLLFTFSVNIILHFMYISYAFAV